MNTAQDYDDAMPAIRATDNAIMRRLRAEGATPPAQRWVLFAHRALAEDVIMSELARATRLTPDARRVFMSTKRETYFGQRISKRRRSANPRLAALPFRSFAGEYYLYTDKICYVVDHNEAVTVIIPTQMQIETLERLMPEWVPAPRAVSIIERASAAQRGRAVPRRDREPVSTSRPIVREPAESERHEPEHPIREVFTRPVPQTPSWFRRPDVVWTIMVVDDVRGRREFVRQAMQWLRASFPDGLPEPILFDEAAAATMDELYGRLSFVRRMEIPQPPAIDWSAVRGSEIPSSARRWWKQLMHVSPSSKHLVTIVLPETARAIMEIADGSSDAAWRTDPQFFDPGTVYAIRLMRGSERPPA